MATSKSPARRATVRHTATRATPAKSARSQAAAKAATPPARKPTVKATAPVPAKTDKANKPKKAKLVRDSFTIPKDEFVVIQTLKARGQKLGRPVKKSELLRAGIKLLAAQTDANFKAALSQVPTIKTGRPKSAK